MKMKLAAVMMLLMVSWSTKANAQLVDPNELGKINIVGISEWEIQKSVVTSTNKEQQYIARIRVQFENKGSVYAVFQDPQFHIALRVPGALSNQGTVRTQLQGNVENRTTVFNDPNGRVIDLGPARLPNYSDIQMFNMLAPGHDAVDQMHKTKEFTIPKAATEGGAARKEVDFIVELGEVSTRTADKLLMEVFNIVSNQSIDWKTIIRGQTKLGVTRLDGSKIIGATPVSIEMIQKPSVRVIQ